MAKIKIKNIALYLISIFWAFSALAQKEVVNVYAWTAYIPQEVVKKFEKETKIRVNLSEYDSNETMYAKIKAAPNSGYDVILPSNYFLHRMLKQNLLHQIDRSKLSNFNYINPRFLKKSFDPKNQYSIPYLWGATGIAVNSGYIDANTLKGWKDIWRPDFNNQLLILDDMREVFSMALLTLGYSVNDKNPEHIKEAYLKLKELLPNVKIFNSDVEQTIYIDEDAVIGMAWNGDINLSISENPKLKFIYPEEGFVLWIDCLAITKNAPHLENAHKFINFLLRPDIAKSVSMQIGYATPNLGAVKLLPKQMRDNPVMNPDAKILERGQIQTDIDDVLSLYEKYWELLKIGG